MDLSTLIGTLLGVSVIGMAMASGEGGIATFIHGPSMLIVFGGTFSVTMMSYTLDDLKGLVKVMMNALFFKLGSPAQEIDRIISYANLARREGLLALENKLQEVEDRFFGKGMQLVIDGFASDTVRDILDLELEWERQRHTKGKKLVESMGAFAPAFGMIGTLVGLVQMLQNLSDPSKIGGGMATALLTTMYGAMAANMFFIPVAGKLEVRAKEEALLRELMIEGIVAIQSGEKPQLIKEKLKGFLPPTSRELVEA